MSPLNRGPLLGPRASSAGPRPLPPPRFGMPPGPLPRMLPPPMFAGHMRHRLPPPSRIHGSMPRANGMLPVYLPRAHGMAPIVPPIAPRVGSIPLRGPPMRPWLRRMPPPPPPQMPHVRHRRYVAGNGKVKAMNARNNNKLEELELKKPWMTDDIRNEIQKKNKLYAKAKKNKDAVEWEEFKDVRNKVTRMIRDAKSEYFANHPDQAHLYPDDDDREDENSMCSDEDVPCREKVCEEVYKNLPSGDSTDLDSIHTCGIDGCTYTANFLLVERHLREEHNKELLPGNKDLSAASIKWMMQRRSKILQMRRINEAKQLEKIERGEIIEQISNVQPRKVANRREKKFKRHRKRRVPEIESNRVCTVETYRGLRAFSGIREEGEGEDRMCVEDEMEEAALCENNKIYHLSDEDDVTQAAIIPEPTKSVLPSLVADYKDDTDNDVTEDETPEEQPIERHKVSVAQDNKITESVRNEGACAQVQEDSQLSDVAPLVESLNVQCTVENVKSNSEKSQSTPAKRQDNSKSGNKRNWKGNPANNKSNKIFQRYHNKFLENLLARDIQHERNLICQCMKYIIDNNFFDSGDHV